jgi:hypothetical protein
MKNIILICLFFFPLISQGARWHKAELSSTSGVKVEVSYQRLDYVQYSERRGIYPVHLYIAGANNHAKVRAVLINHMMDKAVCGRKAEINQEVEIIDLKPFGDNSYAGYLTSPQTKNWMIMDLERRSYCRHQISVGQEIAVVIDGQWLQDPISLSSNFRLNL